MRWRGEDSNLRRLSQQIYSLPRLTASVPLRSVPTKPNAKRDPPLERHQLRQMDRTPASELSLFSYSPADPPRPSPTTRFGIGSPLTPLRICRCRLPSPPIWSWRWDSNPQPADYKSAALPVELRQHGGERRTSINVPTPFSNRMRKDYPLWIGQFARSCQSPGNRPYAPARRAGRRRQPRR